MADPRPDDVEPTGAVPSELAAGLRQLAEHLDRAAPPTSAEAARARVRLGGTLRTSGPGAPLPVGRKVVLAAAAALLLVLGAVVAVRVGEGGPHRVDTAGDPDSTPTDPLTGATTATTADPPRVTTTSAAEVPADPRWTGPSFDALPTQGLASLSADGSLVLFDLTGAEVGRAAAPGLDATELWNRAPELTVEVGRGPTFQLADAQPAQTPQGCDRAIGAGGVRLGFCPVGSTGDAAPTTTHLFRITGAGERQPGAGPLPGTSGVGHWRSATLSPDGRWILGLWSGECETPSAWLLPVGGGEPRLATGGTDLAAAPNSYPVGWTPEGDALISIDGPDPGCGSGLPDPGTYAVDVDTLDRRLLVPVGGDTTASFTWRRAELANRPERVVARALAELGLPPCCGEPSHGGPAATSGAVVDGTEIAIGVIPTDQADPQALDDAELEPTPVWLIDEGDPLGPRAQVTGTGVVGTDAAGPFVSFTCGGDTWRLGQSFEAGATRDQLITLARRLLPHAYCTPGYPPFPG